MVNVMVVDDDRDMRAFYSELIPSLGHDLISLERNGDDAISKFVSMENKPDLLIIDQRMPKRSGMKTVREILSMEPREKVLFVSLDPQTGKAAMEIGAKGFIEKPFDINALDKAIKSIIK